MAARRNIEFCAENGIHAVVGTSGFTEADFELIRAMFTRSNCLIAPNFAIGAVLMMRFAEIAAPFFETAEIIEFHHNQKVDAPSGTAISTAERMSAAGGEWAPGSDPDRDVRRSTRRSRTEQHRHSFGEDGGDGRTPGGRARNDRPESGDPT